VSALRNPLLERAMAVALGAVFVYASLDKIAQPAEFARIVYRYQLLGPNAFLGPAYANLLAATLPWVELAVGLLLIAGLWRREAALVAGAMLVMFVGAVGWTMVMGIDVENCGCFSVGDQGRQTGWTLLLGDLVLLAMAVVLVKAPLRAPQTEPAEADVPVAQS
jgi:uncharacterized membrane protein YphA (DoxX/SURF4 family)